MSEIADETPHYWFDMSCGELVSRMEQGSFSLPLHAPYYCGLPLEVDGEPFTLGGTCIVTMQRVRCVAGHWYDVVLSIVDEP